MTAHSLSKKLGVNIDHVATLRQARKGNSPDPVGVALICEKAGADGITAHLREDRRHIQDDDMRRLASTVKRLNMEMAVTDEMVGIAVRLRPHSCCLVPEKREELTTEGGLDAAGSFGHLKDSVARLMAAGIVVSIFIDPDFRQIEFAAKSGAEFIELHTGTYANSSGEKAQKEVERLAESAEFAKSLGLEVNAGHGIDYLNIDGILRIPHLVELNIGYSIICRSVFTGIGPAVSEMLGLMRKTRHGH